MTTLHHIGELLRSGVRPTDEETEHLRELGGFVAEMYGRFMGGQPEHLTSSADLFSGKLSSRLSAATGARWEQGLGLAELLVGSELTSFWQIARQGLAAGYEAFGAEMDMVDLYEEDAPEVVAESEVATPRRRRPSLFGKQAQGAARGRVAPRKTAAGASGEARDLELVKSGGEGHGQARWVDGGEVELSVIKALASGGLFVGDQVVAAGRRSSASPVRGRDASGPSVAPIALDGLRVDARTPALATALARAQAVFGQSAALANERAAVTEARLGQLTAGPGYSIDRGFGQGERPVYGFFDSVETTYLNLVDEAGKPASEQTPDAGGRQPRGRGAASRAHKTVMPASARGQQMAAVAASSERTSRGSGARGADASAVNAFDSRAEASTGGASVTSPRGGLVTVSLDRVVPPAGGLRPFVGGVFQSSGEVGPNRSATLRGGVGPVALATEVTHAPNGQAVVRVRRAGMSAPRYAVVEAERAGGQWSMSAGALPTGGVQGPVGLAFAEGRSFGAGDLRLAQGPIGSDFRGAQASVGAGELRGAQPFGTGELRGAAPSIGANELRGALPSIGVSDPRSLQATIGPSELRAAEASIGPRDVLTGAALGAGDGLSRGSISEAPRGLGAGFSEIMPVVGAGAEGAALSYAGGAGGVRTGWRLAADGGSDLPLGATFSRHEVFAGTRAAQGVADVRALRSEFRPSVARGDEPRPSELAQVLDGMVWVTLPEDGSAPATGEEMAAMGLAAVPRRRAAMVPAGLAFQSIAGAIASRGAVRDDARMATGPVSVASREGLRSTSTVAGPRADFGATALSPSSGVATTATAAMMERGGPAVVGVSLAPASDGLPTGERARAASGFDVGAFTLALRSGMVRGAAPSATGARKYGEARVSEVDAGDVTRTRLVGPGSPTGIGAVEASMGARPQSGLADSAIGARPLGGPTEPVIGAWLQGGPTAPAIGARLQGEPAEPVIGAWLQGGTADSVIGARPQSGYIVAAAVNSDGVERGLRAMRLLEAAVSRGGYGRIESERELLSLAEAASVAAGEEPAAMRAVRRVRGAEGVMFSPGALRGVAGSSAGDAARGEWARVPEAEGARPRALPDGVTDAAGPFVRGDVPGELPRTDVARSVGGGEVTSTFMRAANAARAALLRPVPTARESRSVASAFGPLVVGSDALTGAVVEGMVTRDAMTRAVQRALARGLTRAGSDEPVLGRLVERMNARRAAEPGAARWDVPASVIERLAGLAGAERQAVARAFARSGWSEQELEMLRLETPQAAVASDEAATAGVLSRSPRQGAVRGAIRGRGVEETFAGAPSASQLARMEPGAGQLARTERIGRSLARVLTGTEALGGGVADRQTGAKAGAIAQGMSATWLPLLGRGQEYFGGLGPSAVRGSASQVASLREAVGDLVKMAEASATSSETPVALAAQRQVLKRVTTASQRAAALEAAAGAAGASLEYASLRGQASIEGVAAQPRTALEGGSGRVSGAVGLAARLVSAGVDGGGERAQFAAVPADREGAIGAIDAVSGFDRSSAFVVDRMAALAAERVARLGAMGAAGTAGELADLAGGAGVFGLGGFRDMRVGEVERTMLGLEREPVGLEARLAEALALAAGGPAGARRMMRQGALVKGGRVAQGQADVPAAAGRMPGARSSEVSTRGARGGVPGDLVGTQVAAGRRFAGDGASEAARVRETVMSGSAPDRTLVRPVAEAMHDAAIREETRRGLSVKLGSVMAPEAMLGGLRSPELSEAIRAVATRQASYGFDVVPVLTTLADSGVDLEAARSSIASVGTGARGLAARRGGVLGATASSTSGQGEAGAVTMAAELAAARFGGGLVEAFGGADGRGVDSVLATSAPERSLVRMLAEAGDAEVVAGAAPLGRQRKAGLLSAILRGTERAEMTALLEQAGGREFAFAWLNRVDGTRSGLDIGMQATRQEFGQAFGRRRDSVMAGESPIAGASLVDTSARGEDKSGLRSVAASMVHTATGAARPQHGASQAIRRTDWSFVDTGSRTATPHADLTKLASAIIGSADAAQRAPMPLVAPAAKAIAQTALRDPTTKSAVKNAPQGAPPAPAGDRRGPVDAKMSEKAIEMLAIEMAGRVARLMGLMNERRGVWS